MATREVIEPLPSLGNLGRRDWQVYLSQLVFVYFLFLFLIQAIILSEDLIGFIIIFGKLEEQSRSERE